MAEFSEENLWVSRHTDYTTLQERTLYHIYTTHRLLAPHIHAVALISAGDRFWAAAVFSPLWVLLIVKRCQIWILNSARTISDYCFDFFALRCSRKKQFFLWLCFCKLDLKLEYRLEDGMWLVDPYFNIEFRLGDGIWLVEASQTELNYLHTDVYSPVILWFLDNYST